MGVGGDLIENGELRMENIHLGVGAGLLNLRVDGVKGRFSKPIFQTLN